MSEAYRLLDDNRAIQCLKCGTTSYNPTDVQQRYCGFCHRLHDDDKTLEALRQAMRFEVPGSQSKK